MFGRASTNDDGKAEAGTALLFRARFICAIETLENAFQVFLADATSRIDHFHTYLVLMAAQAAAGAMPAASTPPTAPTCSPRG